MQEDMCAVCYDPLGVRGYTDVPDKSVNIEGECIRLGCGHALHSKCTIQSLQAYKGKCILCNVSNLNQPYSNVEERLEFEGACRDVLDKIKKIPTVREALLNLKAFEGELNKKRIEFQRRVKEHKRTLRTDMKIDALIKEVKQCKKHAVTSMKKEATKAGSIYGAALFRLNDWNIDRWLFSGIHGLKYDAYFMRGFG
jgi:hypothetical protein